MGKLKMKRGNSATQPPLEDGEFAFLRDKGKMIVNSNGRDFEVGVVSFSHAKSGVVHTLVGTMPTTGLVSATFKATADFTENNTFSINGTAYTAKPNGEELTLPDKAFVTGDVVSVAVDVSGKKINFRVGGGGYSGNSTLPSQIKNFTGQPKDKQIQLTWTNPPTDFAGLIITRKAGSMPNSISDGTKLQCGTSTSYLDTGLINGTTYFYRAFPYNSKKQFQTELEDGVVSAKAGYIPPNIADASWEQIDYAVSIGQIPSTWTVGSEKNITLTTGEVLTLQIYGLYHDDLTNGGKAGITFGLKNLMGTQHRMNATRTNVGGYVGSELYPWVKGTLFSQLPTEVRSVVKSVNKRTSPGGGSTSSAVKADIMQTFLFSGTETVEGYPYSVAGEGARYPIFNTASNLIKKLPNGVKQSWWLRSSYESNSLSFCMVYTDSTCKIGDPTNMYSICFGFCV